MDKKFLLIIIAGLMVAETCEAHLDKQPATHTTLNASPSHGKPPGRRMGDDPCPAPSGNWQQSCTYVNAYPFNLATTTCLFEASCPNEYGMVVDFSVYYNPGDNVIFCGGQLALASQC